MSDFKKICLFFLPYITLLVTILIFAIRINYCNLKKNYKNRKIHEKRLRTFKVIKGGKEDR